MSSLDLGTLVAYLQADDSDLRAGLRDAEGRLRDTGSRMSHEGAGIGRRMGSSISSGLKKTVKAGFAILKRMSQAGLLAIGAIAGTAITAGFKRLNAIDVAKKKLAGLGNSAKDVQTIMGNALASVKGTAYGLDEAATTAASVVAAGVKPGKQLQGVLKTVADTATIAGASMSDTGAIFGSVAARGKLQGDDLMQLQSRGVPVLAFLAKHYHTTAAAASDMVSSGEVDFKNFAAAMHENLGGAAKKSGDTVGGAFANLKASLGRIGAGLLGGVFPKIAPTLMGITKAMGPLEDKAGDLGKSLGGALATAFDKIGAILKRIDWSAVGKAISDMAGEFTSALLPVLSSIWSVFQKKVMPALAGLGRVIIGTVVPAALSIWRTFATYVLPVLESIWKTVYGKLVPAVISIATAIIKEVLPVLADLWHSFAKNVMPALEHLWQVISTKILPILIGLAKFIATKVIPVLLKIAGPILKVVFKALGILINVIADVIGWLADHLVPGARSAFNFLASKAKWLWRNGIKPSFDLISGAARGLKTLFWTVVNGIGSAYTHLKSLTLSAVKWVVNKFLWFAQKIIDGAARAFGWIPGVGGKLKNAAKGFKSFREKVNRELSKIQDKKVKVSLKTPGLQSAVGLLGGPKAHPMAAGGTVQGRRAPYGDKVLTHLAPGEEVISNRHGQADRHRVLLKAINSGKFRGLADGGTVFNVATSGLAAGAAGYRQLRISMNKATSAMVSMVSKAWSNMFGTIGMGSAGDNGSISGVRRWAGVALQVLRMFGYGRSWLPRLLHRMQVESGGNPRAINLWDSNAARGTPSKGLMQVIGPTFAAYAGRFRSLGIWNPLANIYAAVNYALHRYGIPAVGGTQGYARGTLNASPGWRLVGERGPELMRFRGGEQVLPNGQTPGGMTNYFYLPNDKAQEVVRALSWQMREQSLPGVYGRA